jgi:hypothetical protein
MGLDRIPSVGCSVYGQSHKLEYPETATLSDVILWPSVLKKQQPTYKCTFPRKPSLVTREETAGHFSLQDLMLRVQKRQHSYGGGNFQILNGVEAAIVEAGSIHMESGETREK